VYVFHDTNPKMVGLLVKSASGWQSLTGTVKLDLPLDGNRNLESASLELRNAEKKSDMIFFVYPAAGEGTFSLAAHAELNGKFLWEFGSDYIYEHIHFNASSSR